MANFYHCNLTDEEAKAAFAQFDLWVDDDEMAQIRQLFEPYLFYETFGRKNYRDCYCTRCGAFALDRDGYTADFFATHHGEIDECPRCGEMVTLISLGRMRNFSSINQSVRVTICRTAEDGALLLISGIARSVYSAFELGPNPDFDITKLTYLAPGKRFQWKPKFKHDDFGHVHQVGWVRDSCIREPFVPNMTHTCDGTYYLICSDCIGLSGLRYCRINDYYQMALGQALDCPEAPSDATRYSVKYLAAYTSFPAMEMAVRLGFYDAVRELLEYGRKNADILNWAGKNPAQFLRLTKAETKVLRGSALNIATLRFYKAERKAGRVSNMADFLRLVDSISGTANLPLLDELAETVGCSMMEAVRYIERHSTGTIRATMTLWRDYLKFAADLGYDLSRRDVSMPRDLQDRHDAAAATVKINNNAKEMERYKARYAQLRKMYEFSYGGMSIVVPESSDAIVEEGKTLHHCVGGYAARHIKGTVDILFFRKERKPDTSFVTIELVHRKTVADRVIVVQIHGYRNERYPHSVSPQSRYAWFLDAWTDWLAHGSKRDSAGKPILPKRKEHSA